MIIKTLPIKEPNNYYNLNKVNTKLFNANYMVAFTIKLHEPLMMR